MDSLVSPADASAKLLDVRAVAKMLGCSQRHVYRLADAERMPAPIKIGSLVQWSAAELGEWIDEGCPPCEKGGRK